MSTLRNISIEQTNFKFFGYFSFVCRDSVVGIETRYWLHGSGIESRWGQSLPHTPTPSLRLKHPHIEWVPVLFSGGKITVALRRYPLSSSVEVKETIELYLYSPSGPSWHVIE